MNESFFIFIKCFGITSLFPDNYSSTNNNSNRPQINKIIVIIINNSKSYYEKINVG